MRGQIHNYLIKHKDEIVETLKELIKIPSVRQTEEENAPFGKECAENPAKYFARLSSCPEGACLGTMKD